MLQKTFDLRDPRSILDLVDMVHVPNAYIPKPPIFHSIKLKGLEILECNWGRFLKQYTQGIDIPVH